MRTLTTAIAAAALAGTLAAGTAAAQTVGLGTTQGGATGQIATAIAQVVTQTAEGVQVRPQAVANTAQYIPPINAGQLEFGIANAPQTGNAFTGTGMSQGQANPNLRMVAALFPFNAGLVATGESGMRTYADLRGKRVPWFQENSLGDVIMRAALEAGGLTPSDVVQVPTPNFPRMFEGFRTGQLDTSIAAVGSQVTIEFDQSVAGGVRYLSFRPDDLPVVRKWLPGADIREMQPDPAMPGVEAGTRVFSYAYTLFTHAGMDADVVYKVAKAMHDGAEALRATGPLWSEYDTADLFRDIGVPYHPGAERFYREAGIAR